MSKIKFIIHQIIAILIFYKIYSFYESDLKKAWLKNDPEKFKIPTFLSKN